MKTILKDYILLLAFLSPLPLLAQIVNINFTVATQRSLSRLEELQDLTKSGQMLLTITNLTPSAQIIRLEASMSSPQTPFSIHTNPDAGNPATYTLLPNQVKMFTANELANDVFYDDSFVLGDNRSLRDFISNDPTGQVPTGIYRLCLTAKSILTDATISNTSCANVTFQQFSAPLINTVNNVPCPEGGSIPALTSGFNSFPIAFTPPIFQLNNVSVSDFRYTIYMVEILPEDSRDANQILQAMQSSSEPLNWIVKKPILGRPIVPQIVETLLPLDFLNQTQRLELGHKYAVAVLAESNSVSSSVMPNEGFSPVCVFVYGQLDDLYQDFTGPICGQPFQPRSLPNDLRNPDANLEYNGLNLQIGPFLMQILSGQSNAGKVSGNGVVKVPWMDGYIVEIDFNDLVIKYSATTNTYYVIDGAANTTIDTERFTGADLPEFFNYTYSEEPRALNLDGKKQIVDRSFQSLKTLASIINQAHEFPKIIFRKDHTKPGNIGIFSMHFTAEGATMNVILDSPDATAKTHLYKGILNYPVPFDNVDCLFSSGSTPNIHVYRFVDSDIDPNAPLCGDSTKKAVIPWNLAKDSQTPGLGAKIGFYYMTSINATEESNGKYKGTAQVYVPWIKEQVDVVFEDMEFAADIDNKLGFYATSGVARAIINTTSQDELMGLTLAKNAEMIDGYTPANASLKSLFSGLSPTTSNNWQTGMSSSKDVPFKYSKPGFSKNVGVFGISFYPDFAYINTLQQVVKGIDTTYYFRKNQPATPRGIECAFEGELPISVEENLPIACLSNDCSNIVNPTDGVVVTALTTNDVVRVGCFKITIKNAVNTNGTFNGEGTVMLPFLKANFGVRLVNLVVKKSGNTLFATAGEANGLMDESFPNGIATNLINTLKEAKNELKATLPASIYNYANSQTVNQQNELANVFTEIGNTERFIHQIADEKFTTGLPIGYSGDLGSISPNANPVRLGIFGMSFFPGRATMNLIAQTPIIPGINQNLYFGAINICFTPSGISASDATFYMGGDLAFSLPGGHKLTLKGSGNDGLDTQTTFIRLKENHIDEIKVTGEVELNRDIFVPKPPAVGNLKIQFATNTLKSFDDLLISSTATTDFGIKGLNGWGFTFREFTLDLSTGKNATGFVHPSGNDTPLAEAWTGIYVRETGFSLPSAFNLGTGNSAAKFKMDNLSIGFGSTGLSFDAHLKDILTIDDGGSLANFGVTIDSLNMKMVANEVEALNLKGGLRFGLFDAGTYGGAFPYKLDILKLIRNSGNSGNSGNNNGELALALDFELDENVALTISKLHTTFTLGAHSKIEYNSQGLDGVRDRLIRLKLNGKVSIGTNDDDVNLPEMAFQNFVFEGHDLKLDDFNITFASPQKFVGGAMRTDDSKKAGGFPISIQAFRPVFGAGTGSNLSKFGFGFDIVLNLKEGAGFGLTTGLDITTQLNSNFTPTSDIDVTFKKISIDVNVSVAHVIGSLEFIKDDHEYGKGFRGCITVEMNVPAPITGTLQGMFGTTTDSRGDVFRYFYIEGSIKGIQGAIIPGTPIAIDGFAGGFWYNMIKRQNTQSFAARLNMDTPNGACIPPELVPTKAKMGIALGVMFKEAASGGFSFNGMMAFEAELTTDLAPLTFTVSGAARFVKMPALPGEIPTGKMADLSNDPMKIAADMSLTYDFTKNILTGDFNVYLNIGDKLKGKGPNDRAGKMVMYFGANDWYIFLGNPWGHTGDPGGLLTGSEEDRYATLEFTLGPVTAEAGAYFCMGTYGISGLPPLPSVDRLKMPTTQRNKLSRSRAQADARNSQGGVSFGAYMSVDFDKSFGPVDAYFNAGFGFDVALVKYTESTKCGGNTIGINGAYARGQVYGYVDGGLKVDFLGDTYQIFELKASFFGDFGGPNPTWVDGEVSISNQSIIDAAGLLSWGAGRAADGILDEDETTSIAVSLGTKCTPSESASFDDKYGSFSPITTITPSEGGTIEPFGTVTVSFNKRLNATWSLIEPNQEAHDAQGAINNLNSRSGIPNQPVPPAFITHVRRWFISSIKVLKGSTELMTMTNRGTFSADGKDAQFLLYDPNNNTTLIRAGDQIKFQIKLGLEEVNEQGVRTSIVTRYKDGSDASITRDVTLTVSQTNFELANSDINFCYPMNGQKYFLKGESNTKRFIKLTRHIPEMVAQSSNHKAKIYADNVLIAEQTVTYQKTGATAHLMYDFPADLPNSADIRVEFYTTPNTVSLTSSIATITNKSTKTAQTAAAPSIRIYAINFRTSRFNTFADKMGSARAGAFTIDSPDSYDISTNISTTEPFDDFEIYSNRPIQGQTTEERYYADRQNNVFNKCIQVTTKLNTAWHNSLIPIYDAMIRNIDATSWEEYAAIEKPIDFKQTQKPIFLASISNSLKFLVPKMSSERFEKVDNLIGFAPLIPPRRQMAEASRRQARAMELSFGDLIRNSPNLVVETAQGYNVPLQSNNKSGTAQGYNVPSSQSININSNAILFGSGGGILLYHRYNDIVRRGDVPPTAGDYQFSLVYRVPALSMTNGDIIDASNASPVVNLSVNYEGYNTTIFNQQKKSQSDVNAVKSFR